MTNNIKARLQNAERLRAAGDFQAAEAAFGGLLADEPNSPYLHLCLSELKQARGAYREAHAAALAAADGLRKSRHWQALPYVTLRLLAFEEHQQILQSILAADWSRPEVLMQSPVLSQHLWLTGAYSVAIELLDRASKRARPSPLLLYSRANALRYGGRLTEATQALEDCIALDPNFAQAHWTLAYHESASAPGARVDRVRRAKTALRPGDAGHAFLDYALFKELDDAGDTDAAWQALESAMRNKRAELRYDAATQEAAIVELARAIEADPIREEHGAEHAPLFIVGLPRTGTTLLERILTRHERMTAGGELADFSHSLAWELDRFVSSPPAVADQAHFPAADWAAVGQRYLGRTAWRAKSESILVDKNPSNLFHAGAIARALPHSRIVCLLRDPMDACFSNLKELFPGHGYGYSYDLEEMVGHHRVFSRFVAACERAMPNRFRVVRYEELARSPENVVESILRDLGLNSPPGMTDTLADERPVLTASASQVRQAVHTNSIGAWRRYERQLAPIRERLDTA